MSVISLDTIGDIITAAALDKLNKSFLYLGSKDTNIYKVNLNKGFSCEPLGEQYSMLIYNKLAKVTRLIASEITKGILICIAETNILIWNAYLKQRLAEFFEHKANVIYANDIPILPHLIESIDESFKYIRWDWETKEIILRADLMIQSACYLAEEIGLVGAIIKHMVFIGTSNGYVRGFIPKIPGSQNEILIDDGK